MPSAYSVQLLWSNNAQTTLANSISNTSLTANLASGAGALFPSPGTGQGFTGTFTDAATGLLREVVLVTSRSGDTITMTRAQEGTTALNWTANDLFGNLWTAGAATTLVQATQLQSQASNYGADSGVIDAYVVALSPVVAAAPSAGMPIRVKIQAGNTNTGAATLNAGWGVVSIVRRNGSALIGGELVGGYIAELFWNGSTFEFHGVAPATSAAVASGTDTQSFVTPAQLAAAIGTAILPVGQCQMVYSSATSIKLNPFNGNRVPIAGELYSVPAAGITANNTNITLNGVAAQNLAADSNYLVALNDSLELEFWSLGTGHNPDTTTGNVGVEVITGHVDKTLVGMVGTNASSQFSDTDGSRLVLSWFNRVAKSSKTNFTGNPSTSSGSVVELSSTIRNTFLTWGTDAVEYSFSGSVTVQSSSQQARSGIGFDGTTAELEAGIFTGMTTASEGQSIIGTTAFSGRKVPSQGRHFATALGVVGVVASACTWTGGTTLIGAGIPACTLGLTIMG